MEEETFQGVKKERLTDEAGGWTLSGCNTAGDASRFLDRHLRQDPVLVDKDEGRTAKKCFESTVLAWRQAKLCTF